MPLNLAELDFRTLPVSTRLELVTAIGDSIEADTPAAACELSPREQAELLHRSDALRAHPERAIAWEQVRQELKGPQA